MLYSEMYICACEISYAITYPTLTANQQLSSSKKESIDKARIGATLFSSGEYFVVHASVLECESSFFISCPLLNRPVAPRGPSIEQQPVGYGLTLADDAYIPTGHSAPSSSLNPAIFQV